MPCANTADTFSAGVDAPAAGKNEKRMSWRLLFVTLLAALGASAWAGLQLGDWLVAHAPAATAPPGQDQPDPDQVVLDADGKPYVAQPPQPRVDGTLGVPRERDATDWNVPTVSLFETVTDPSVLIARDRLSPDEARKIADAGAALPSSPSDVATLDVTRSEAPAAGRPPVLQPVEAPPAAPPAPPPEDASWQDSLRRELAHCATLGFFERPTCAWAARNKYCAPNAAWGSIDECPRRP